MEHCCKEGPYRELQCLPGAHMEHLCLVGTRREESGDNNTIKLLSQREPRSHREHLYLWVPKKEESGGSRSSSNRDHLYLTGPHREQPCLPGPPKKQSGGSQSLKPPTKEPCFHKEHLRLLVPNREESGSNRSLKLLFHRDPGSRKEHPCLLRGSLLRAPMPFETPQREPMAVGSPQVALVPLCSSEGTPLLSMTHRRSPMLISFSTKGAYERLFSKESTCVTWSTQTCSRACPVPTRSSCPYIFPTDSNLIQLFLPESIHVCLFHKETKFSVQSKEAVPR
ncbi:hypothetical protein Q8A67_018692 [Cirrhinus molitorella]|uniref:Uncharacterized protein n=1 Tax=Cirrhinus molitorella TaxID=172907 RepID=A0AA88PI55_9TELE|nr:hypothetical protein Q8A67_018692 [Cirrhinus molitorella]